MAPCCRPLWFDARAATRLPLNDCHCSIDISVAGAGIFRSSSFSGEALTAEFDAPISRTDMTAARAR